MKNCDHILEYYVRNGAEDRRVARHMSTCDTCRSRIDAAERMDRALARTQTPGLPQHVRSQVLQSVPRFAPWPVEKWLDIAAILLTVLTAAFNLPGIGRLFLVLVTGLSEIFPETASGLMIFGLFPTLTLLLLLGAAEVKRAWQT